MKRQLFLVAFVALLVVLVIAHRVQTTRRASTPVAGLDLFQGRWELMRQQADGQAVPTGDYATIEGNLITFALASRLPCAAYVIEAVGWDSDPPSIDWTEYDGGGRKVASQHGVFRLDGDTLVIRVSRPGEERPDRATREPGQPQGQFVFRCVQ